MIRQRFGMTALGLLVAIVVASSTFSPPPTEAQDGAQNPAPTMPATLSATPSYAGLGILDLVVRPYGNGEVTIEKTLSRTAAFTRYLIHYPSDGLTIYGFMDVPTATPRKGHAYPVIVAVHGYIDPRIYQTLDYTTRYADALATAGYLVLHPNLRGYQPSDSGTNLLRVGFAIDVLNLVAIVRQQGGQPGSLRVANPAAIGLWGHSMGGGISIRAMTVDPMIQAVFLYAPISGDDRLNTKQFLNRPGQYDPVPDDIYQLSSPINFYDRIQAAVSVNQGLADTTVPPEWSADLCSRLEALHKSVECYTYAGENHIFTGAADRLLIKRMIAFFNSHL